MSLQVWYIMLHYILLQPKEEQVLSLIDGSDHCPTPPSRQPLRIASSITTYTYTYIHISTYMYNVCVYVSVCIYIYIYTCVYIYIYIHMLIHVYTSELIIAVVCLQKCYRQKNRSTRLQFRFFEILLVGIVQLSFAHLPWPSSHPWLPPGRWTSFQPRPLTLSVDGFKNILGPTCLHTST